MTIKSKIKLNDGSEIPILGFGTFLLDTKEINISLRGVLKNKYPMIDTAQFYNNEYDIGQYLNKYKSNNRKIFLTTKVWMSNYKFHAIPSIKESLKRLNVDCIDLILMHMPYKKDFLVNITCYKELMKAREQGLVKSIGVSNFSVSQLNKLYLAVGEWPSVNQFAFSPANQQAKLVEFCNKNKVVTQGYSLLKPLADGIPTSGQLTIKEKAYLTKIGKKYKKSPQQIILRWALQKNMVIFPKSKSIKRIKSNIELFDFELNKREMLMIKKMDKKIANKIGEDPIEKMVSFANKWSTNLRSGLLYDEHSLKLNITNKIIKSAYGKNSLMSSVGKKIIKVKKKFFKKNEK